MDWLSKLDFPKIILAAATSRLGILALLVIVVGVITTILFRPGKEPAGVTPNDVAVRTHREWIRLFAFGLLLLAAAGFVWRITNYADVDLKEQLPPKPTEDVAANTPTPAPTVVSPTPTPTPTANAPLVRTPKSQHFEQGMNFCQGPKSGQWTIHPEPGSKIDPTSVDVKSSTTTKAKVDVLSKTETEIVISYFVANDGSCGPQIFGEHVGKDARGKATANVSWVEVR